MKWLDLSRNWLNELPESISKLLNLENGKFEINYIESIPKSLEPLINKGILKLEGNPIDISRFNIKT